jgi:hypothetical protein
MSTESEDSTIIQSYIIRIAYLKGFRTLKIGLTGTGTYIIQMSAKTIAGRMLIPIWRKSIALRIWNAQISKM